MKVSVIIPFREENPLLEQCIESVKKQDYEGIEIIAVGDRAKLKRSSVVSIFDPSCRGAGEKRNLGAKKAKGEVLFFLDSDCILKENSVSMLVKTFEEHKTDAVSGKPLAPRNANILGLVTGLEYEDRFDKMGEGYVDVAATTCLGILKEAFQDVGGFVDYSEDEAVGEDWDFSARLKQKNYSIYHTNKVEVFHEHASDTLMHYLKRQYEHAKYRIMHFRKHEKITDQYSSWAMILSSTLLLNLPATARIYFKTRNPKVFVLPFVSLLRSFVWLAGAAAGVTFRQSFVRSP